MRREILLLAKSMRKSYGTLMLLAVLLLSSFCVESLQSQFGINLQNVQAQEKTKREIADVITIADAYTLPKPPVLTSQPFDLFIELESKEKEKIISGYLELYDTSVFHNQSNVSQTFTLLPTEKRVFDFSFLAPTNEEIANVKLTPRISFRVLYDFSTSSSLDVVAVNLEEVRKAQQAGESLSFVSNKVLGSGPVKIDISLVGSDYVLAGYPFLLQLKLLNEGRGMLKGNEIKKGKLKLIIPDGFEIVNYEDISSILSCEEGVGVSGEEGLGWSEKVTRTAYALIRTITGLVTGSSSMACRCECENIKPIKLYQRESAPITLKLRAPDITAPYQTFVFRASASYTYELRDYIDITVQPIE